MGYIASMGKLVTLSPHLSAPPALANQFPYSFMPFYFHVPPAQVSYSESASWAESDVIKRGTVAQAGGAGLAHITFDSSFVVREWYDFGYGAAPLEVLPSWYLDRPSSHYQDYTAYTAVAFLRRVMRDLIVVNLKVVDQQTNHVDWSGPVTIRQFDVNDDSQQDVRPFSIQFAEHRFVWFREVPAAGATVAVSNTKSQDNQGRYIPSPHTTKQHTGIKVLAQLAYRDKSRWVNIVKANGGAAGMFQKKCTYDVRNANGPWIIPPNTKLIIPLLDTTKVAR